MKIEVKLTPQQMADVSHQLARLDAILSVRAEGKVGKYGEDEAKRDSVEAKRVSDMFFKVAVMREEVA